MKPFTSSTALNGYVYIRFDSANKTFDNRTDFDKDSYAIEASAQLSLFAYLKIIFNCLWFWITAIMKEKSGKCGNAAIVTRHMRRFFYWELEYEPKCDLWFGTFEETMKQNNSFSEIHGIYIYFFYWIDVFKRRINRIIHP